MTRHYCSQIVEGDDAGARPEPAEHLVDGLRIEQFTRRNDRGIRRPLATLLGSPLDRRLAEGCPPESDGLLAARAERIVSVPRRRQLVRDWERMLNQALTAPRARNPHAPLCRYRIIEAMDDVGAMLGALSSPLPVSARGVAMASRLLSDGTGPLYNRARAGQLSRSLREVTGLLDPARTYTGTSANRL